jgi:hypothetical protein
MHYSSNAIPFLEHCSLCSTTFEFCAKTSAKMALLVLNLDPITKTTKLILLDSLLQENVKQ